LRLDIKVTIKIQEVEFMPKLTKRIVETAVPQSNKAIVLCDTELKGFQCKITPTGKRTYLLYYRNSEGQERRPSIGTHGNITCEQARDIARQWLAQVARGEDPSLAKQHNRKLLSITEFIDIYLERYSSQLKPKTLKEEKSILKGYIKPDLGKLSINTNDRQEIMRLHQRMKHTPYRANRVLETVSKLFNLAMKWEYRTDMINPCTFIDKYKEKSRERFLSNEELATLSDVLKSCEMERIEMPEAILAIRLLLLTGCRKNEICQLQWDWIDFSEQRINLPDSKTGKKTIYLSAPAIELLHEATRIEGNPYVLAGKGGEGNYVSLQKAWVRIRNRAGLEDVRLHDLRHSFASMAASGGLNLYMIGKLLGHTQQSTTQRYAHLVGKPLQEANSMIADRIMGAMEGKRAEVIDFKKKKVLSYDG
jgi:integrase